MIAGPSADRLRAPDRQAHTRRVSDLVPRQRPPEQVSLRCATCGAEQLCEGGYGSMRLAEESVRFQSEHAACGVVPETAPLRR